MVKRKMIDEFLSSKKLAIVGVSRNGKKFGNTVINELRTKGYKVFPVNSHAKKINDEECFSNLNMLPEKVDGAVIVVPFYEAERVVRDALNAGINNIWLQQGSESKEAINFCESNGMNVIYGECILMFAEPTKSFHRFHRTINKLFGKLPK
ncbi:MAG: CoA-binding protein [Bacteroidetes bacterium]|nr:CoA-binding protein [Bacteroidota bacterium]